MLSLRWLAGITAAGFLLIMLSVLIALSEITISSYFTSREIAHAVGFTGMGLVALLYWGAVLDKQIQRILFVLHLILLGGLVLVAVTLPTLLPVGALKLGFKLQLYGLGTVVIAHALHNIAFLRDYSRLLILSTIGLVAVSLSFEMWTQPHVHVYGGPPRGEVQVWQIVADFSGIALSCALLFWLKPFIHRGYHPTALS